MRVETKGHLCRGWTSLFGATTQLLCGLQKLSKGTATNFEKQLYYFHLFNLRTTHVQPCNQVEFFKLCKLQKKASIIVDWSLSHVRLFATPWTVAHLAPLSMWFSRQEYWNELPFPSLGDLPDPGIKSASPAQQADSLPLSHLRGPILWAPPHLMLTVTTRNRYCHLCSAEDNRTEALPWIIHLLCTHRLHSNLSFDAHKEPMMWTLPVSWCDRWRNWGTESEQLSNIMHTARGWVQMLTQSPLSPKPPAPGSSGSVHLWEELQQQMRGDHSWAAQSWSPPTHKPTHKSNGTISSFLEELIVRKICLASKLALLHSPRSIWPAYMASHGIQAVPTSQDKEPG